MGQKLKIAGWVTVGALAGALTTVQLQATARGALAPLPLEELQQLAAVKSGIHGEILQGSGPRLMPIRFGQVPHLKAAVLVHPHPPRRPGLFA